MTFNLGASPGKFITQSIAFGAKPPANDQAQENQCDIPTELSSPGPVDMHVPKHRWRLLVYCAVAGVTPGLLMDASKAAKFIHVWIDGRLRNPISWSDFGFYSTSFISLLYLFIYYSTRALGHPIKQTFEVLLER